MYCINVMYLSLMRFGQKVAKMFIFIKIQLPQMRKFNPFQNKFEEPIVTVSKSMLVTAFSSTVTTKCRQ